VSGLLQSATNPENGTVSYSYDWLYRLASKIDAKGQTTAYAYDSLNRLTDVYNYSSASGPEDTSKHV